MSHASRYSGSPSPHKTGSPGLVNLGLGHAGEISPDRLRLWKPTVRGQIQAQSSGNGTTWRMPAVPADRYQRVRHIQTGTTLTVDTLSQARTFRGKIKELGLTKTIQGKELV